MIPNPHFQMQYYGMAGRVDHRIAHLHLTPPSPDPVPEVFENKPSPKKYQIEYGPDPECLQEILWEMEKLLSDAFGWEEIFHEDFFDEFLLPRLQKCRIQERPISFYGLYYPAKRAIHYFLKNAPPNIHNVVRTHERWHAAHHLLPSKNSGLFWDRFSEAGSFNVEFLAQLFTYFQLKAFDPSSADAMVALAGDQGMVYRTFLPLRNKVSDRELMKFYWAIRESGRLPGWLGKLGDWWHKIQKTKRPSPSSGRRRNHGTGISSPVVVSTPSIRVPWKGCQTFLLRYPEDMDTQRALPSPPKPDSFLYLHRKAFAGVQSGTRVILMSRMGGFFGNAKIGGPWQGDSNDPRRGHFPLVEIQPSLSPVPFKDFEDFFRGVRLTVGLNPISSQFFDGIIKAIQVNRTKSCTMELWNKLGRNR